MAEVPDYGIDFFTDSDSLGVGEAQCTLHDGEMHSPHPATPGPMPMPPATVNTEVPEVPRWRQTRRIRLGE